MTRYALIISCEEYSNFQEIAYCNSDAGLIQETLVDYCDYEYKNIDFILQYKGCDDTPDVIYRKIQTTIEKSEEGDTFLFYFAGHGIKENDKGYLLLADSIASDFQNTALDLKKINDLLRNSRINGFLILDACHSGILARNAFNSSVADTISDTGCITLASCSENEESYPDLEKEQGVFTYCLCEEIKKVTAGKQVFIEQLKVAVCNSVGEWAKNNYRHQTPTLNGQIVGNTAIAIRNDNIFEGTTESIIKDNFKKQLKQLEEDFFNKCYCVNVEFGLYDINDVLQNYSLAQDICWRLENSKYTLVDEWQESLVKLQYYASRIEENRKISISLEEQREVLNQIRSFVESIPIQFEDNLPDIQKNVIDQNEIAAPTNEQIIRSNISDFLMNYAEKVDDVINDIANNSVEKSTIEAVYDEACSLYTSVLRTWLTSNTNLKIRQLMPNNKEWRVFGKYYVYLAYDDSENPWIVMLNKLDKINYSNTLHSFKNLKEIKDYYTRFGKEYKYCQIVVVSQSKEKELEVMMDSHTKLKSIFNNREIMNTVVYLKEGKFNFLLSNYSTCRQ